MIEAYRLVDKLERKHSLSLSEYKLLIESENEALRIYISNKAKTVATSIYGNFIYVRGLIEVGNYCRNDCLYCGIRKSNTNCDRYILDEEDILNCCKEGYDLGFRTFVLQGGEGIYKKDFVTSIVQKIHVLYPDCAITLSLGEEDKETYKEWFDAGANRYLLRHETASKGHYEKLHPENMSFEHRMQCLRDLKNIGYQVGCGFMVGSPYQTSETLAMDLKFIETFKPDKCGIGPFISQKDTPFRDKKSGTLNQTLFLLSLIRLIQPNILLPATTALGTIDSKGREKGILAGANVVMPNLSPVSVRKKYALYDNKICTGEESAECKNCLSNRMRSIGYEIVTDRGDIKK